MEKKNKKAPRKKCPFVCKRKGQEEPGPCNRPCIGERCYRHTEAQLAKPHHKKKSKRPVPCSPEEFVSQKAALQETLDKLSTKSKELADLIIVHSSLKHKCEELQAEVVGLGSKVKTLESELQTQSKKAKENEMESEVNSLKARNKGMVERLKFLLGKIVMPDHTPGSEGSSLRGRAKDNLLKQYREELGFVKLNLELLTKRSEA